MKTALILSFIAIVGVFLVACFGASLERLTQKEKEFDLSHNTALFGVWVKQTGNVKQLTLEEFVALKRSGLIKLNSE